MIPELSELPNAAIPNRAQGRVLDVAGPHPSPAARDHEEKKPRSLTKEWLVGIIVALIGALSTIAASVFGTEWFPELVGFRSNHIYVNRTILYARILHFRDRERGATPLLRKPLGLVGSQSRHEEDLFDEALYIRAFYLKKHKATAIALGAHSSGIVDVTPIIPSTGNFVTEAYDKSDGRTLDYHLDIKDKEYVLVAHQYYNGYQYNPKKKQYESDGGIHIDHPTDEAILVFDFTGLDYTTIIRGEAKAWIKPPNGEKARQLPATFENGVLTTSPVKNPPVGSQIYCDWEWSTERTG